MKVFTSVILSMILAVTATLTHADNHAAASNPVGMVYGLDVADPAAFAAAMSKYWGSETGEKIPGVAILRQVVAAGESSISHTVAVVHPSYDAMDASFAMNAMSEDWATFLGEVDGVAEVVSSSMFESTGLGSVENKFGASPGLATLYVFISVSDPSTYAAAFQEMMSSTDIGETDTTLFSIPAGGIDETTHVVAVTGKSVWAVMSQMTLNRANPNFQKFISQVSNIRAIEQNIVTVDLAVFGNVDS